MARHRASSRVAVLLFVFVLSMLALTGTASAHAQLVGTDPHAGDVLAHAPTHVTLTFGEQVEVADNAIEVFDDHLARVDDATVSRVPGHGAQIRVGVRPQLHVGTYTVTWHVTSDDTHPVSGAFRFSVGAPSRVTGTVAHFSTNDTAGVLLGVARFAGYAGLILGPGALLVLLSLWPAGLALPRPRRTVYLGLALLGAGTIISIFLDGVWASGQPLRAMWLSPSALDTHSRRFDMLYAYRAYLLLGFGALAIWTMSRASAAAAPGPAARSRRGPAGGVARPARDPIPVFAAASAALLLFTTWTLAGHPATGMQTPVAIAADLLHVSAMAVWLGGLAVLTYSLRSTLRESDLAAVLPRFSQLAFGCVLVLVVTGTYQSWRELGSIPALFATAFGRLLLLKLLAVAAAVAMGAVARRWVRRHLAAAPSPWRPTRAVPVPDAGHGVATSVRAPVASVDVDPLPVSRLQRGLLVEVGIAVAVLSATSALVVAVPGRESYIRPFSRTLTASGLAVSLRIDGPRAGDAVLHVTVHSSGGDPLPVRQLQASVSLPDAQLGPFPLRLPNAAGSAHDGVEDLGITFPRSGSWVLNLSVKTSQFDETVFSAKVPVR